MMNNKTVIKDRSSLVNDLIIYGPIVIAILVVLIMGITWTEITEDISRVKQIAYWLSLGLSAIYVPIFSWNMISKFLKKRKIKGWNMLDAKKNDKEYDEGDKSYKWVCLMEQIQDFNPNKYNTEVLDKAAYLQTILGKMYKIDKYITPKISKFNKRITKWTDFTKWKILYNKTTKKLVDSRIEHWQKMFDDYNIISKKSYEITKAVYNTDVDIVRSLDEEINQIVQVRHSIITRSNLISKSVDDIKDSLIDQLVQTRFFDAVLMWVMPTVFTATIGRELVFNWKPTGFSPDLTILLILGLVSLPYIFRIVTLRSAVTKELNREIKNLELLVNVIPIVYSLQKQYMISLPSEEVKMDESSNLEPLK